MTPSPRVCPRPGPHDPGPDCPLWDARERIALQRSIEADTAVRPSLGQLVWVDFNRGFQRPSAPPTRPVPIDRQPVVELAAPVAAKEFTTKRGVRND